MLYTSVALVIRSPGLIERAAGLQHASKPFQPPRVSSTGAKAFRTSKGGVSSMNRDLSFRVRFEPSAWMISFFSVIVPFQLFSEPKHLDHDLRTHCLKVVESQILRFLLANKKKLVILF